MLIILVCLLQFRKYTDQDITKNFRHDDVAITVGRAGLAFVLLLSFPLLIVPCRQTLNKVCLVIEVFDFLTKCSVIFSL